MNELILVKSEKSHSGNSVMIEDNGQVCYAYVLDKNNKIVGDLWLYNRASTPEVDEWSQKSNSPFLNSREYTVEELPYNLPDGPSDWTIEWDAAGEEAHLFVKGKLAGIVAVGEKPGRSAAAKKSGPLAKQF